MRSQMRTVVRVALWVGLLSVLASLSFVQLWAQTNSDERTFPQPKASVEKALKAMQANLAGHLPVLEGFAKAGEHPLAGYERGYYQATVQVSSTASGGSLVRVSSKVTAWYTDPSGAHSGYQLLTSNGRIESDFLDQLAEQLAKSSTESGSATAHVSVSQPTPPKPPVGAEPAISAPAAKFPETQRTLPSSLSQGLAASERTTEPIPDQLKKTTSALQAEADSLEEVLKNQAHPNNLVAVKESGTPVVATPSLTAKAEFLASAHDEFELLDFNADWVHVRISGLSRGWIWRRSVEMPEGIPDTDTGGVASQAPAAELFHVTREETARFPGDWEPLRSKSVKIISVQNSDDNAKGVGPRERLEYAKFLLEKGYKEIAQKPQDISGIVVIFDSADGGMIAATMATLGQWRGGILSDSALWHKCFFDPPETFDTAASSGSQ
jgi:hypothetical protein